MDSKGPIPMKRLALVLLSLVCLITATSPGVSDVDNRSSDRRAQFETKSSMNTILDHLNIYQLEHEVFPSTLEVIFNEYHFRERSLLDGWGRPLSYYKTTKSYVLISFGSDGKPDRQPISGFHSPATDYDADMVTIGGEWARLPSGINE